MKRTLVYAFLLIAWQAMAMEWDFTAGKDLGFQPVNYRTFQFKEHTGFQGTGEANGYFYTPQLNIEAAKHRLLEIELDTEAPHVTVYFSRPGAPFAPPRGVRQTYDPKQGKVVFDFTHNREWRDTITKLRIDAVTRSGQHTTIRKIRLTNPPEPPHAWDFTTGKNFGFHVLNYTSHQFLPGKGFQGTGLKNAYFFAPELKIDAKKYNMLVIELTTDNSRVNVYFSRPGAPFSAARGVGKAVDKQNGRVIIDFSSNPQWHGTINGLRIDAVTQDGFKATIRKVFFSEKRMLESILNKKAKRQGIVPNGDFSQGLAQWQGDAESNGGKAILKPGKSILSQPVEMPTNNFLEMDLEADSAIRLSMIYLDVYGKPLGRYNLPLSTKLLTDIPPKAGYFSVEAVNASNHPAAFAKCVIRARQTMKNIWRASWLWNREAQKDIQKFVVFRKDFQIDDLHAIELANLNVTADDIVECRLNNVTLKGNNYNNWSTVDTFSIKEHLRQGRNTMICKVINGAGPGGLLAEMNFLDHQGKLRVIGTDETWLSAATLTKDWWNVPTVEKPLVLAPAGRGPWGNIAKSYLSSIQVNVLAEGLSSQVDQNTVWTAEVHLIPQNDTAPLRENNLNFAMTLTSGDRKYLIAEAMVPGQKLVPNQRYKLPVAPMHFRYVPEGDYQLNITLEKTNILWKGPNMISVRRTKPQSRHLPKARISMDSGRPTLLLNEQPPQSLNHYLVEMGTSIRDYREIHEALKSVPGVWLHAVWNYDRENRPSFQNIENLCTSILIRNPEAHIILSIILDPVNNVNMTPFNLKAPFTMTGNFDGRLDITNYQGKRDLSPSFASQCWLAEGDRILKSLVSHLDRLPYGNRVASIVPSSGISWEWMYWGCQTEGEFPDYSRPFQQAFQQYALKKYGSLDAINQTWHTDFPALWDIVIPTREQRLARSQEDLRLPAKDQYVMDFVDCMAHVTAEAIIHFCTTVKQASQKRLLTGIYYGYINALTHGRLAQHSGHWALSKVLRSDAVDMLMGPTKYSDRGPGEGGGFMIPEASVRLHGKVCIAESDIRTLHCKQKIGLCHNLAETRAVIEREMGALFATYGVMRYYYFSKSWVFNDMRLSQVTQNLKKAEEIMGREPKPLTSPANSMAVITSDNAAALTAYHSSINLLFVSGQYPWLTRSGLAFDSYLASDLEIIPQQHRLWYFLNPMKLSKQQLDYIRKTIIRPGNTVIFAYGINVIDQDSISTKTMEDLLNTKVIRQDNNDSTAATLTAEGKHFLGLTNAREYGGGLPFSPAFYPANGKPLAKTAKGNIALTHTEVNGCQIYFTSLPALKPEMLRAIARRSRLHVYNHSDGDVTWAQGRFVSVHSPKGGPRTISVPVTSGRALSLISGQSIPIRNGKFNYQAKPMSTELFLCQAPSPQPSDSSR